MLAALALGALLAFNLQIGQAIIAFGDQALDDCRLNWISSDLLPLLEP